MVREGSDSKACGALWRETQCLWHYATGEGGQSAMSFLEAVGLHFPVQGRSIVSV